MRKIILGIILGILIFVFFVFFGGGEYVKKLGSKTEKAGEKIVDYERDLKEKIKKAKEGVEEKKEKVKEIIP